MRYTTFIASALVAGAGAVPKKTHKTSENKDAAGTKTETFSITHFRFHQADDGTMSHLSFNGDASLAPAQLYCLQEHPESPEPTGTWTCNNDDYSFAVHFEGTEGVRVRLYHTISDGVGYWGEGFVPILCEIDGDCWGIDKDGNLLTINTTLTLSNPPNWP